MAPLTPYSKIDVWVTISDPGSTDGAAEFWLSATGGGLSLVFAENVLPGYGTQFTGTHRFEPVVLTANTLPTSARQWLADLAATYAATRDVLVEYREGSRIKFADRYRGAAIVAYQGPQFDVTVGKGYMNESIEFVFASVEAVVG